MTEKLSNDTKHTLGLISKWSKPDDIILDIGCGDAEIGYRLEERGYNSVYNIDFVDIRKYSVKNFKLYDGVNLPFKNSFFDFISVNFVLHHVPNGKKILLLNEIKRVSRGIVFILEDTPRNFIDRFISNRHGLNYRKKINSTESFGFYSKEGWEEYFRSNGWKIIASERQSRFCRDKTAAFSRTLFVIKNEI